MANIQTLVERTLSEELNISPELCPMDSGASSKTFFKISGALAQRWTRDSLVLMWMSDSSSFSDYQNIYHFFFKNNICVPEIFFIGRSAFYLIMEDCGVRSLDRIQVPGDAGQEARYRTAIDLMLAIQRLKPTTGCVASQRYFDTEKFMYEFDFHIKFNLVGKYFNHDLDIEEAEILKTDYQHIAHTLSSQVKVFVHRDFQASNLLLNDGGGLTVVDFQDARMGLPLYDLVSLLEDAYISLTSELKERLIRYYLSRSDDSILPPALREQFLTLYDWTLIQRKLHDAGAFVFCFENFGNKKYLPYIPTAVGRALSVMERYDVFSGSHRILSELVRNGKPFQK